MDEQASSPNALTTVFFTGVDGRLLEKRTSVLPTTICESSLAMSRAGLPATLPPFGRAAGHPDAELHVSASDLRAHWTKPMQVALADALTLEGATHPLCSRGLLRGKVSRLKQLGVSVTVGLEVEFYLLAPQAGLNRIPLRSGRRQQYDFLTHSRITCLMDAVQQGAARSSIPIQSLAGEYEPGQYELALCPADPVKAADDFVLLRQILTNIAQAHGCLACLLPKPFSDSAGSGLHLNLSFESTTCSATALRTAAANALAANVDACTAIWAPTVNSYKRLREGDLRTNALPSGSQRTAAMRLARGDGAVRLEVRVPDCLTTAYLALAICLAACESDTRSARATAGPAADGPAVPRTLPEALHAMENNAFVLDALGTDMRSVYEELARLDLTFYERAVPDIDFTLNGLPPIDGLNTKGQQDADQPSCTCDENA